MTRNFSKKELSCKCGCGKYLDDEVFLYNLQLIRDMYGKPMVLSSAYRCPNYNDRVSSTGLTGPHTKAAVDVLVYGKDAFELLEQALMQGFIGIGISQKGPHSKRFIHLDRLLNEGRPWVWSY